MTSPVSDSKVLHWLPEVAASMPHRSWYRVYVPVATVSHCPQISVARSLMVLEGAGAEAGMAVATARAGARTARSFIVR